MGIEQETAKKIMYHFRAATLSETQCEVIIKEALSEVQQENDELHKHVIMLNREIGRLLTELLKIKKRVEQFISIGPDYRPMMKHGWVRTFVARKKKLERLLGIKKSGR